MMSELIRLDIAGIPISIRSDQEKLIDILGQRYKAFLTHVEVQYDIDIWWEQTHKSTVFTMPSISFDSAGFRVTGPGYTGYYNVANRWGDLTCNLSTPIEAIDYFLRVVIAVLTFEAQGILLHGAGILHKGKGYLFMGQSGSGKTTISKLSVDDVILNDDLIILKPAQESWMMFSTPFWNPSQIEPSPYITPLSAVYLLKKDRIVYLEPFRKSQALAELLANVPIIAACEKYSRPLIDRCIMVLEAIPAYKLHFLPDHTFWQIIDDQHS